MTVDATPPPRRSRGAGARTLLILAIVAALTALARWRLLDVPLERDEGGFALMARLLLDGVPPYAGAYDYKPPGLYLVYALFISLFGSGPAGIHLGLLVVSVASVLLAFGLAARWSDETGGLIAASLTGALLLSGSLLGFAAHATHFVVFFALAGFLLLERGLEHGTRWPLVAAGAAFGAATLMKQPGAVFFLAALVRPFLRPSPPPGSRRPISAAMLAAAGFVVPLAAVALWLSSAGALDDAIEWLFRYPSSVAAGADATGIVPRLWRNGIRAAGPFLPAWLAGAAALCWFALRRRAAKGPLLLISAAAALSIAVGYETRTHYFVLLAPAFAIGLGVAASDLAREGRARFPAVAALAAPFLLLLPGLVAQRDYLLTEAPAEISRRVYAPNLFADAGPVAAWIREHSLPDDRVAVLGSEPEIPFLAGRRPASKYLFTNFFNERHGRKEAMEREMIAELDSTDPAVIVVVNDGFSWGARPDREWPILRWAEGRLALEYELAGTVTPSPPGASLIRWGDDARRDSAAASAPMVIYRRLPAGGASPPPR